jgi:hypothetical protein
MDQNKIEPRVSSSETNPDEGFDQQHGALLPLNNLFKRIRSTIEDGFKGWGLKDIGTALYLHEALVSLGHWSDNIKNGKGTVLTEVEEYNAGLAHTIRRCLNDITSGLTNFRPIYEDGTSEEIMYEHIQLLQSPRIIISSKLTFHVSAASKPFETALTTDVECLRLQVDPIRLFTDGRKGVGKVAIVRVAVES